MFLGGCISGDEDWESILEWKRQAGVGEKLERGMAAAFIAYRLWGLISTRYGFAADKFPKSIVQMRGMIEIYYVTI